MGRPKKKFYNQRCKNCNLQLNTINFSALMTEQWTWNGYNWECVAHHSLIYDADQPVRCPECDVIVGTGEDFGFVKIQFFRG